jgi:hypothetical protein
VPETAVFGIRKERLAGRLPAASHRVLCHADTVTIAGKDSVASSNLIRLQLGRPVNESRKVLEFLPKLD